MRGNLLFRMRLVAVCLVAGQIALPQTPAALEKEIDSLRAEVKSLHTEVDQLNATVRDLTSRATPTVDISSAPVMGDPSAKVIVIEYSDFQCPFCMEYFTNNYHKVIDQFVKTGKVKYVARDFPGEKIHPDALKSAEAARCANEQGKYWEMHDALFNNQKLLGSTGITDSAKSAGLNMAPFQTCFSSGKYTAAIRK